MECREARDLLWDLYKGELPAQVHRDVTAHIASCPACAREARICREVTSALAPREILRAPQAATMRVMAEIRPLAARKRLRLRIVERLPIIIWAAASVVIAVLGLQGLLPGSRESRTPLARVITAAFDMMAPVAEKAGSLFSDAAVFGSSLPDFSGWLMLLVAVTAAVLALCALEEHVLAKRLQAKFSRYRR